MTTTITTSLPTDGQICAYVTNKGGERVGHVFRRAFSYHLFMYDDRFSDADIARSFDNLDDALMFGFLADKMYEEQDKLLAELSHFEAEARIEATADFWDSVTMVA